MKSIVKSIRLSKEQLEQINDKLCGMSFSEFALLAMLNETPKKAKRLKENRTLIVELAKWGNNLNQVAKHLNAERRGVDRVALEMLKRIEEHLKAIRLSNGC
jgi:precorrin-6B methylase 1